jgi:hypothetical protein
MSHFVDDVKPPKVRSWVYWTIRCSHPTAPHKYEWVCQRHNGRWTRRGHEAGKFTDPKEAQRVAKYLTSRVGAWNEWQGYQFEVLKVIVDKKLELEWPLTLLDKLVKG